MTVETLPPVEPVRITIPAGGPFCDVNDCELPAKADMVWWDQQRGELHLQQVCARCTFLFKGHLPALWAPLDQAPPLERIAHELQREMARRAPKPSYRPANMGPWQNVHVTFNGTTSGGTGGYFSW